MVSQRPAFSRTSARSLSVAQRPHLFDLEVGQARVPLLLGRVLVLRQVLLEGLVEPPRDLRLHVDQGNSDRGHFAGRFETAGRTEEVLLHAEGPGVINYWYAPADAIDDTPPAP